MRKLVIGLFAIMLVGVGAACDRSQGDLKQTLDAYQEIASHQEEAARSLRLELQAAKNNSLGDKLVVTETAQQELPKTIAEAEAQGYTLLDMLDNDGALVEAACFAHEGVRHYGKVVAKTTDGVNWHGAPFILMYDINSTKLSGMVLESTTAQSAPPWEYHAKGHPGMDFPHWSMHLWFSDPPRNLSLEPKLGSKNKLGG